MDAIIKKFNSISDALGIQWAPFNVPLSRRLQTLAVLGWMSSVFFGEIASVTLFILLLYSSYWWLALLYGAWMINDLDICNKGGRPIDWLRNSSWWRYYQDYFPVELVKTTELDTTKNYLFACFPHGIICSGYTGVFAGMTKKFTKIFPGMMSRMIILGSHFRVPFFRELMLYMGYCASSQESILHLLDKKKNRGNCVALIVGGAAEALDAHPGEYKILLGRRKGFVRIAMLSGAPLVPVFSFGEIDVFRPMKNPENSFLRKFQEKVKQITGISPILPMGRGILQYSFGVLPLRAPITIVVGAPMEVERKMEPTDEEVDAVHAEFTKRLVDLFESEKSKYLKDYKNTHLTIT